MSLVSLLIELINGLEDAAKHAVITKHLLKLRNWSSRKGIVASIEAKVSVMSDPFDNEPHLFGFKNGVYDLIKMEFRAGLSTDYVCRIAEIF